MIPPVQTGFRTVHIQVRCEGDLLLRRLRFWEIVSAVWDWVPATLDREASIFVPPGAFASHIFCHQVPLSELWRAHRFDSQEADQDLLSKVALHPKKPQE